MFTEVNRSKWTIDEKISVKKNKSKEKTRVPVEFNYNNSKMPKIVT